MVENGALDRVFHALAHPARRDMIHRLSRGPQSVTSLAEGLDMSLAAASKHVRVLEEAGLLHREVRGRTHRCDLAGERLAEAERWLSLYQHFWTHSLDNLERLLSEKGED